MAAELRELIQQEHAVMRHRHFAWHRYLAPADQPDIGNRVMGDATRARGGACGMLTSEAEHAVVRVVSRTSGSAMASRIAVSRRANTAVPAFAGLSNR